MSKHLGAYSSLHGPAGKTLTDYVEVNIPQLWNAVPERITNVGNTGKQFTGIIPGYTTANPFRYVANKFFFFTPHVNSLASPFLSLNGLPLLPFVHPSEPIQLVDGEGGEDPGVEPFADTPAGSISYLEANAMIPGGQYLLWIRNNTFELLLDLSTIAATLALTKAVVQQIPADTGIPAYKGNADILETAGFAHYQDGGGKLWKRGSTVFPDPTDPPLPAYFRRKSFDGHWYDAIIHNTIFAEVAGLLGDPSVNISSNLNDLIAWMGGKGGGRIILPPGYNRCNSDIIVKYDGIELSGTSTGNGLNEQGSTLYMAVNGAAIEVGGRIDLGEARNANIAINNMALTCDSDHTSHFISSHAITGLRLSTLYCRGLAGLHLAGDNSGAGFPNSTINTLYENISGFLLPNSAASFIHGLNCGNFSMRNCIIAGGEPINDASNVLYLPSNASAIPTVASITSCSFQRFGEGIKCNNSISNLMVSDTAFTDMRLGAVRLVPDGLAEGCRFSNCSFIAHSPPSTDQIGALLADGGLTRPDGELPGRCTRISFSNCQFLYWGRRAIELQDHTSNVHISNCQFEDNCAALDNATSETVINVAPGTDHITITGNQIYKRDLTGVHAALPKYGINVLSTSPHLLITNNQINDAHLIATALGSFPVNNPNRGPAHLRKIFNNTRQVFEGQVVQVGPWVGINIPSWLGPGTHTEALPLANVTGLYQVVAQRRGKVVGIAARANAAVTGIAGCITFNVTKNNAIFGQSCTTLAPPTAECFDEDIDGNDFLAGDRLGIWYTINTNYAPGSLDWNIFISIYYD